MPTSCFSMPEFKSICIPAAPPVDVSNFLPLIDHEFFQRLRHRKQLGINSLVFPGALHSRFEHALGVLSLTQNLCRIQNFSPDECLLLQGFALLHDIGHGPFSHQIEPVLQSDHHKIGLQRLQEMEDALVQAGLNLKELGDMMLGKHTLAAWISDRNLGTDKLDYLHRDALHIGFKGTPDLEKIQFRTLMCNGTLAIGEKHIEDAKQLQKFYSYLHQHGYLNKTALAVQRMLQRAVQEELLARQSAGEQLWDMSDRELINWLENAKASLSRKLAEMLEKRRIYRSVLVLKPNDYGFVEKCHGKDLQVFEWSRTRLNKFSQNLQNIGRLRQLENNLAQECGLQKGELLCALMPRFAKLLPKDLMVCTGDENQHYWLLERDKDHNKSLESDYLRTFAVRIIVVPEKRTQIAEKAENINELLKNNALEIEQKET